jgi:hypothetical protein
MSGTIRHLEPEPERDWSSRPGAEALAAAIRRFWAGFGHDDVRVWIESPAVEADQRLLIDEPSSPPTLTGWRQGMVVRNGLTAGER